MEIRAENLNIDKINVKYNGADVGVVTYTKDHCVAFQYCDEWIASGFSISPFSIPLKNEVFISKYHPFEGNFGVFNDSLPDGWGRLLIDRKLSSLGIDPDAVCVLARLALLGKNSMGALEYFPKFKNFDNTALADLDKIAHDCELLISDVEPHNNATLDSLLSIGGSSGGARPKCFYEMNGEEWIVKFKSSFDKSSIGKDEYRIALAAKKCGLLMSDVALLPSKKCSGYFATKRFDRKNVSGKTLKRHYISASGLLETSHRIPNLDYHDLLLLTLRLTKNREEVLKMFKLMVFNVLIGNKDDHSKNFGFIYDDRGFWETSPVFDLTTNNGFNGEHTTTINGKGKDISSEDIFEVAKRAGIKQSEAKKIVDSFRNILSEDKLLVNEVK